MENKKSTAPAPYEDYADHFSPLEVRVGANFEDGFRRFKSLIQRSRVLSDYKRYDHYEKPSDKKRRKLRESQEKARLLILKEKMVQTGEWDRKAKKQEDKRQRKIERQKKAAEDMML